MLPKCYHGSIDNIARTIGVWWFSNEVVPQCYRDVSAILPKLLEVARKFWIGNINLVLFCRKTKFWVSWGGTPRPKPPLLDDSYTSTLTSDFDSDAFWTVDHANLWFRCKRHCSGQATIPNIVDPALRVWVTRRRQIEVNPMVTMRTRSVCETCFHSGSYIVPPSQVRVDPGGDMTTIVGLCGKIQSLL